MILETGNKIYGDFLQRCVNYVNIGWGTNYKIEDVAGIELSDKFLFVHFNKEEYTKEAYPINISIEFK